jgi:hypothetical protein
MHGGNKQDKPTLYNPMKAQQQTAPLTHQHSKT